MLLLSSNKLYQEVEVQVAKSLQDIQTLADKVDGAMAHLVPSAAGDLPTESAALSNDPQADHGHSERLGSLTPSVSHSASPSSLEVHHPCKVSPAYTVVKS